MAYIEPTTEESARADVWERAIGIASGDATPDDLVSALEAASIKDLASNPSEGFNAVMGAALEQAKSEVKELIAERSRIDVRIVQYSKAIAAMSLVCNVPAPEYASLPSLRLTDNCHAVVAASDRALSPKEIRDALIDSGYELGRYSNVLASIHTVMKRLAESGRVQKIETKKASLYAPLNITERDAETTTLR